jgi:hypothetical protein
MMRLLIIILACGGARVLADAAPLARFLPSWVHTVHHMPAQPRSGETVQIVLGTQAGVASVAFLYQVVDPGAYIELKDSAYAEQWNSIPMMGPGKMDEGVVFKVELPGSVQKNRRLIRYRFATTNASGLKLQAPDPKSTVPNLAYFVYDGIPAWTAAICPGSGDSRLAAKATFSAELMRRVQAYHLIAKKQSVENATWHDHYQGKDYPYSGTLVVGGEVYDHVGFRARGGVWRYLMGKNMWKFNLPDDHTLQAVDDFGNPYPVRWDKVNLRSCIQQGDYGHRGEQGMFETIGFRLFNLAGVPAPFTHWVQLRIVSESQESPADQYRGDFWGLYLAIENEDGKFLKTHKLPDGNLYKMQDGSGELEHQGTGAPSNRSDLLQFLAAYARGNPSDDWWRANVHLPSYYSYRAICESIHHYDISDGKNYDYYLNPVSRQWQVIPWDIDLTWANNMYGMGNDPFYRRVLTRPTFALEYRNRLGEIRDLLFNLDQTSQLIDEYASVIWNSTNALSFVEADRRKWDYHPMMARSMKGGHGLFYEASATGDFRGMIQLMKNYVKARGAWIDKVLLNDPQIPATPTLTAMGTARFPANQLRFRASAYQGAQPFAAVRWRLAEVTPLNAPATQPRSPRSYEMAPVWESPELANAALDIVVPASSAKPGHTYRVRARMKDATGRWSHWSAPIEFIAGTLEGN